MTLLLITRLKIKKKQLQVLTPFSFCWRLFSHRQGMLRLQLLQLTIWCLTTSSSSCPIKIRVANVQAPNLSCWLSHRSSQLSEKGVAVEWKQHLTPLQQTFWSLYLSKSCQTNPVQLSRFWRSFSSTSCYL